MIHPKYVVATAENSPTYEPGERVSSSGALPLNAAVGTVLTAQDGWWWYDPALKIGSTHRIRTPSGWLEIRKRI